MKVEKMLIFIVVTCSLLLVSSMHVTAAEGTGTLEDVPEDVIDQYTMDLVTENDYIDIDNIDITKVDYIISDGSIEFTIEVVGEIENRGSLDQMYPDPSVVFYNVDLVIYSLYLSTSTSMYSISYINNTCQVLDVSGTTNLTASDFSTSGDTLTVSFEWNTTDEEFEDIYADAQYMRMVFDPATFENMDQDDWDELGIVTLIDQVPNGPLQVYADVTNLGEVGKSIEFLVTAYDGAPPYEYLWEFGDGETSTEPEPHTYDTAGEYDYILTLTDSSGTSESSSGEIEIVGGEDGGTPGFELIIAIAAIGLIFLWKRKR